MDDIAHDIAQRQADFEHNEYLVHARKPPVHIEVHVLREIIGADGAPTPHFHKPYYTTLTHLQGKEDPDALFTLLRRCLPFEEWEYVDESTTDFDPYLYLLKPGEGTEAEEIESWHFHDYLERLYVMQEDSDLTIAYSDDSDAEVSEGSEGSEPVQGIRDDLRELQMGMFRQFWNPKQIYKWWFVLKART